MLDYPSQIKLRSSPPRSRKNFYILLTGLIIAILPLYGLVTRSLGSNKNHQVLSSVRKMTEDNLLREIEKIIQRNPGTYSLYVYDLKGKKGFGINEKTVLTAASVNKLAILAALYHMAGKKEIDLEKVITLQKDDVQDYGTGSIRYDEPGTTYSLKTLARLMMEKSDNTAAYILANHIIGVENIQTMVDSWEMTQTEIVDNKTSVYDMSVLLTKMYNGEITTGALTPEMLDFTDSSDFDDRIPKNIPSGIKIYHKSGNEIGKIHDVGIVNLPGRPYFLGVMTNDITDEEAAKNNIAEISRIVFDYLRK